MSGGQEDKIRHILHSMGIALCEVDPEGTVEWDWSPNGLPDNAVSAARLSDMENPEAAREEIWRLMMYGSLDTSYPVENQSGRPSRIRAELHVDAQRPGAIGLLDFNPENDEYRPVTATAMFRFMGLLNRGTESILQELNSAGAGIGLREAAQRCVPATIQISDALRKALDESTLRI